MPGALNETDLAIVRHTAIFGELSPSSLGELLAEATVHTLGRGEILFLQGDPAAAFFVVLEGWLKIYRLTTAGDEATKAARKATFSLCTTSFTPAVVGL